MLIGHKKQWEFFKRKFELNSLSHAYLFSGAEGIGKKIFSKEFVKFVNCLNDNKPCGKCVNCQMIERDGFPDFMLLSANKRDPVFDDGGEIKIAKVREVQKFLNYKSYYGSFKSVIVDDAEKMNQEAQSCFLKTLEEPKGKTILFLITSKPDMILPTITSRCQIVKFFRPESLPQDTEKVKKEQKIFDSLISVINSNFADKFKYVKSLNFAEQDPLEILEVMQKYLRHLLLHKSGVKIEKNNEYFFEKPSLIQNYSLSRIKDTIDLTEDISNKLFFTNANPKLALEILLTNI